jgi:ammonium transporter, Amt family
MLGAGILWFGWFGFNAGSALAANGLAATAFLNTMLAGGTGMLGRQALAALVTIVYSGVLTFAIAWVMQKTIGLRATREAELSGIDEAEHAETAYDNGRIGALHAAVAMPGHSHRGGAAKPPAA